ncbi:MAG: 3-oxoacyl-ACP reductase FabG [Burkholderiaceae bacterium]|nr:3-oxoacyl-ACP reductase FabG [Burkholderiaceae bacterium]
MNPLLDLSGEVALVTGASRGLGAAIALSLAQHGATVIGTATSDTGAQTVRTALAPLGGTGVVLDVTDFSAADAVVQEIQKKHGKLSILVNNAGITRDGLAMRMKDEDWSQVIHTNLSAAFNLSRSVMRSMMKAKHGKIINISSVIASMGNAGQANYAAAKAGLEGMTRALAKELGSRNITVNAIAPGFIDTDMTRALSEQQAATMLAAIPLAHFGQAGDIANAVLFLASPMATYITGTTLHVNGGLAM